MGARSFNSKKFAEKRFPKNGNGKFRIFRTNFLFGDFHISKNGNKKLAKNRRKKCVIINVAKKVIIRNSNYLETSKWKWIGNEFVAKYKKNKYNSIFIFYFCFVPAALVLMLCCCAFCCFFCCYACARFACGEYVFSF